MKVLICYLIRWEHGEMSRLTAEIHSWLVECVYGRDITTSALSPDHFWLQFDFKSGHSFKTPPYRLWLVDVVCFLPHQVQEVGGQTLSQRRWHHLWCNTGLSLVGVSQGPEVSLAPLTVTMTTRNKNSTEGFLTPFSVFKGVSEIWRQLQIHTCDSLTGRSGAKWRGLNETGSRAMITLCWRDWTRTSVLRGDDGSTLRGEERDLRV